ncbi:hypothetical protein [Pseudonocardia alni]|uniref:hypothetical protein n=1 Tax=Pseudonocardia alni TaxID=33907 RepID=UPI00280A5351|nr:hypothetical protein [Pseudonocardia alni]
MAHPVAGPDDGADRHPDTDPDAHADDDPHAEPHRRPVPDDGRARTRARRHRRRRHRDGPHRRPGAAAAASPMWPAGDAATAKRMQQQSDAGGDPWLLDPEEVTISYVGSELGYRNPTVTRLGNGVYAATDGRSAQRSTIRLTQPVRSGTGGIWVVDRVDRG